MADKDLTIKIGVDGDDAEKSIGDINREIKEARRQLAMAEKGTKEWQDAFKRLAAAKDELKDLKQSVAAAGDSIDTLQTSVSGVANGFQALSGVIALTGSESEELNKTMVRLQAVSNITQAIGNFKDLNNVFVAIKTTLLTNPLFIIASVLTAIGVAVYELKDKFKFLTDAVNAVGEAFKTVGEFLGLYSRKIAALNKLNDELTEKYNEQTAALERQKKLAEAYGNNTISIEREKLQLQKDYIANQIAILRLKEMEGKLSEDDAKKLADLRKQLGDVATEQIALEIREKKKQTEEEKKEHEERLKHWKEIQDKKKERAKQLLEEEIANLEFEKQKALITAKDKFEVEKSFEEKKKELINNSTVLTLEEKAKKTDEINKKIELQTLQHQKEIADHDDEIKKQSLEKQYNDKLQALEFEKELDLISAQDKLKVELDFLEDKKKLILENTLLTEQQKNDMIVQIERERLLKIAQDREKKRIEDAQKDIENEKKKAAAKQQITQLSFQVVDGISNLFFQTQLNRVKKGSQEEKKIMRAKFNLEKGINIAKAVMATAKAITESLPDPVRVGLSAGLGAIQIATIAAQQFPDSGDTGSNSNVSANAAVPSVGGGGVTAPEQPLQPLLPQGVSTQGLEKKDNMLIKAVVVETDITDTQRRVSSIVESSSF
jgi:hypothetical protein